MLYLILIFVIKKVFDDYGLPDMLRKRFGGDIDLLEYGKAKDNKMKLFLDKHTCQKATFGSM